MKWTRAAIAAAAIFCGVLIGTGVDTFAGHPFGTEDAGRQGKGNVEVEFNLERQHGSDGTKFRRMGPVEATLKTAVIEGKDRFPTLGVKAGFSLPAAEGDQIALLATAIAEGSFEPLTVFANVGADVGTRLAGNEEKFTLLRASVASSYEIRKEWYLLSELRWEKQTSPSAPSSTEGLIGGKKKISETLSVDAGVRWGLNGDSPHVTYLLGFTLGFRGERSAQAAAAPAGDTK